MFFDTLGLDWEYEPEGFDLGAGVYYLPDFILHGVITRYAQGDEKHDLYVEVKGQPNAIDAIKISRFEKPIWVVGEIPSANYIASCKKQRDNYCKRVRAGELDFDEHCVFCPYDHGTIDGDCCFAFSLGYDYGTLSFHGADCSYDYGAYYPEIEKAFDKARKARFEHGENVAWQKSFEKAFLERW